MIDPLPPRAGESIMLVDAQHLFPLRNWPDEEFAMGATNRRVGAAAVSVLASAQVMHARTQYPVPA